MSCTALERVLHQQCPEWRESIKSTRAAVGFSFQMPDEELWQWLVSGGHTTVKELAAIEVQKLGVESFYRYYMMIDRPSQIKWWQFIIRCEVSG